MDQSATLFATNIWQYIPIFAPCCLFSVEELTARTDVQIILITKDNRDTMVGVLVDKLMSHDP